MNILFPIGAFYPSQQGGPCNTLYWHTKALKRNAVDVSIVTTSSGIDNVALKRDTFIDKECGRVYYGNGTSSNLKTIIVAIKEIKKADILHLNSLFSPLSVATSFYTRLFYPNKKVIWSVRGELSENALKFSKYKKRPLLFLYKILNKHVTFHSTAPKETLEIKFAFPQNEVVEIPNLMEPAERIENVVKKPQLLFVGRIHPIKSIDKLIKALHKSLAFRNSKFTFIIAGVNEPRYASYIEELKLLIKEFDLNHKVKFIGHVTGKKKEQLFAESYFTFLPSETENFGNVVLESLNQGTPVVASLGTPWSILSDHGCGYHVSNEPETLAFIVDEIIQLDSIKYKKMTSLSHKLIDEKFDIDEKIFQWIKIYENILAKNQIK